MFIRFVCDRSHPRVAAEAGMFDAYWRFRNDEVRCSLPVSRGGQGLSCSRVHRRKYLAVREAAGWFNEIGMPLVAGPHRLRWARASLFGFRERAAFAGHCKGTVLLRARDLAHALGLAGIEIREIRIASPGKVIWEDRYQVLAVPRGPMPRAF